MLPLMQEADLRVYRYGAEGGQGSFHIVTAESTDSGRSGTVDDWGTREIEPVCKFSFRKTGTAGCTDDRPDR